VKKWGVLTGNVVCFAIYVVYLTVTLFFVIY